MMENLPHELWYPIFLRLPVKSILRCLSVCKSWKLFIEHPSFINSHLQHQRRDLMFVRYIPEDDIESDCNDDDNNLSGPKPEVYSLHLDDEHFSGYANHELHILSPTCEHFRVVGSCNGIICITCDQYTFFDWTYLWNPTIQKCMKLPRSTFTYDKIGNFDHELGFGFDEKTNDYKVVRIVDPDIISGTVLEVEIYSLSIGIWRNASHLALDLGVRIFERGFGPRDYQVYFNGAVHWVCCDREENSFMIIAFFLGEEVFRCFELPDDIEDNLFWVRTIRPVVFRETLSLIQYNEQRCELWAMKDYGASSSWNKQLDIDFSRQVERIIGIRDKGEILIEISGGLYAYDFEATKEKKFNFLDGHDLLIWKRLQEGHLERLLNIPEFVHIYDPEGAPKELGIRSKTIGKTRKYFRYSFHCEKYVESLILLGKIQAAEMSQVEAKKATVTELATEQQHLSDEADKSCKKRISSWLK